MSVQNIQNREIGQSNFRVAGVDLQDFSFEKLYEELGKTSSVQRGDASAWREQACYTFMSAGRPAYLIFERGEVNTSFYLFSAAASWKGRNRCARSAKLSGNVATASGLHLRSTYEQVMEILGQPSERRQNELVYFIESKTKTEPNALARARAQHPELSEEQFREDYGTYDRTVSIHVKFARSKMIYLGISIAETT